MEGVLQYHTPQHLYFVSNREIKPGDKWTYLRDVHDATELTIKMGYGTDSRVEASTDPSLNLPLIPFSFVQKYVEMKGITEVEIEMDSVDYMEHSSTASLVDWKVKTRQDNTVIVHKVKDSWTREEVEQLLQKYDKYAADIYTDQMYVSPAMMKQWIDTNLE